jgi:cystathionine gamma-lyase
MRFSTRAMYVGEELLNPTGTVVVPIYQVSTYRQREPSAGAEYVYSRIGNPTQTALERGLASLEEGIHGLAFASGMAPTTTVTLSLLRQGDHVVAIEDLYGGTRCLFNRVLRNFDVDFAFVEGGGLSDFEAAIRPETKLIWLETPTNPLLRVVDIESLGGVEWLVEYPASMTHASDPKEDREKTGITDSLIRVSVGIEDVEDLMTDLSNALEHA